MSSEGNKTTTTKKTYAEVVTPSKKKERNNPFLSLSKDIECHTIPTYLSPRKNTSMGKYIPDKFSSESVGQDVEPTLHKKIEELIPSIATSTTKNPHEIIKGLKKSGITTWVDFVRMFEEDIPMILQHVNGTDVSLSVQSLRSISTIYILSSN